MGPDSLRFMINAYRFTLLYNKNICIRNFRNLRLVSLPFSVAQIKYV